MKITVICDVLGKPNNGTTIAALNLIDYLNTHGHDVTVVSPDKTTSGKKGYFVVPTVNLGKFLNKVVEKNNVELAKADEKILTTAISGADVVHLLIPFPLSWKAVKIAKRLNIPVTAGFHCQAENFTAHVGFMNSTIINALVYKVFYNKVFKFVDCIHYPTEFIKNVFEKSIGKSIPNVVISNGVNDVFSNNVDKLRLSEKFTIVCTGRFSAEKSQQTLIKAISLSKHKNDVKLIFAGEGPKKNKLVRLANKYGVDAEFNFYSREELAKILRGADLYVHTAIIEIEAISCTEAIVSGLVPVICDSKRSATRYFAIDDCNLYRNGKPSNLKNKIEYFIDNPDKISEYKEKYERLKFGFNQTECMRQMEDMLIKVTKGV